LVINKSDISSGKFSKERITLLLCMSQTGEKIKPLIIGKSKRPHSFKNQYIENLNLEYENNAKAWMSLDIFSKWLLRLNELFKLQKRKILLLLDNAPVHPINIELSNIELFYFPPNVTSLIQPLDQGIINNLKSFYKKEMSKKILFEYDNEKNNNKQYLDIIKKITLYDSLCLIKKAFDNIKTSTISNCFIKSYKNAKIFDNCENKPEYPIELNTIKCDDDCIPFASDISDNFDFENTNIKIKSDNFDDDLNIPYIPTSYEMLKMVENIKNGDWLMI